MIIIIIIITDRVLSLIILLKKKNGLYSYLYIRANISLYNTPFLFFLSFFLFFLLLLPFFSLTLVFFSSSSLSIQEYYLKSVLWLRYIRCLVRQCQFHSIHRVPLDALRISFFLSFSFLFFFREKKSQNFSLTRGVVNKQVLFSFDSNIHT